MLLSECERGNDAVMNLTYEQLQSLLKRPSMRDANPHLATVDNPQRQSNQRRESQDRCVESSENSLGYCVTIISFRKRLVDGHDNLRTGAKPLVDQITEWLGFASDDNQRLTWQYSQVRTDGEPGTLVVVQSARTS